MDLGNTAAAAYAAIINVNSVQAPTYKRIAPGNRTGSYIYLKLTGKQAQAPGGAATANMPYGLPMLDTATLNIIGTWIDQGAVADCPGGGTFVTTQTPPNTQNQQTTAPKPNSSAVLSFFFCLLVVLVAVL